jgi:hypothetical protein
VDLPRQMLAADLIKKPVVAVHHGTIHRLSALALISSMKERRSCTFPMKVCW